jgi:hypothetical protein
MLIVLTDGDLNWIDLLYFIFGLKLFLSLDWLHKFKLLFSLQPGIMQSAAGFIGISTLLTPFHVSLAPFS